MIVLTSGRIAEAPSNPIWIPVPPLLLGTCPSAATMSDWFGSGVDPSSLVLIMLVGVTCTADEEEGVVDEAWVELEDNSEEVIISA